MEMVGQDEMGFTSLPDQVNHRYVWVDLTEGVKEVAKVPECCEYLIVLGVSIHMYVLPDFTHVYTYDQPYRTWLTIHSSRWSTTHHAPPAVLLLPVWYVAAAGAD